MITFRQYYEAAVTPKGNYMSLNIDGSLLLTGFVAPKTGTAIEPSKYHVTLVYSPTTELDHPWLKDQIELFFPREITATAYEFDSFGDGTLVVKLKSVFLDRIHSKLLELGCTHTYPEYSPHISLYHGVDKKECEVLAKLNNRVVQLPTDIRLSNYISEPIIDDWYGA
jgi:hypothetical protein